MCYRIPVSCRRGDKISGTYLKIGKKRIEVNRTYIMGILNVTPDSFFDGGIYADIEKAIERAKEIEKEGADMLDIGGESSRPGSEYVTVKEEMARVVPVLETVCEELKIPVSIDTRKPEVAEKAIELGADIVNDITGLRDKKMREVVAEYGATAVIMHMKGTPKTMQINPRYRNVLSEISSFFKERVEVAINDGIDHEKIIIDPGIGFGKTVKHNLEIIRGLNSFKSLERPILLGVSRKSFIGKILDIPVEERMSPSIAVGVFAILNGADILRVHDVKETRKAVDIVDALRFHKFS